jgi:hypothetical protein
VELPVIATYWNVDARGHAVPERGRLADEQFPHLIVDRYGVEWTVREVETPQVWAKAARCLVLNSRECVRRIWYYPRHWRALDPETLFKLGVVN